MDVDSEYSLDEIDCRVMYALMTDARNTSAPMIAKEVDVSPGTIRNRINQLEEKGIIVGHHAQINFKRTNWRLTNLFVCNVPFNNQEMIIQRVLALPGVINVRELMGGQINLHVLAAGKNTDEIRQIGNSLAELGIEIKDELLVQNESFSPYGPFGPADNQQHSSTDFISLPGDAEVAIVTIQTDAPLAGLTLEEAGRRNLLNDEALVVTIERNGEVLTPHGKTEIKPGDAAMVFSRNGVNERTMHAFMGNGSSQIGTLS